MSQVSDQISREAGIKILHASASTIRLVKAKETSILPNRKEALLKGIDNMESELGRMTKLLREMRADVLHLSVE